MSSYDHLDKDALIRLLQRRDADRQLGLVWERDEIEADAALNDDYVALALDPALSHGDSPWENLIIEGDNYDALRALRMSHKGAIRCIYIDPPYNTGNRDFVYNDRFVDKTHRFRHSLWLEFMYRRLQLAKELLADDGVIFVSIDDNELFRLGMLMDRVFGDSSHVATVVWQKRYSRDNNSAIGDVHEYLLCYSKNPDLFKLRRNRLKLDAKSLKPYRNPNNDPRGPWRGVPMTGAGYRANMMYEIELPSGRKVVPPEGRHWACLEPEYLRLKREGKVYYGTNGDAQPSVIRYLTEVEGLVPWTWWPHEEVGHTDESRKEIQSIFGTQTAFDTPKPVRLIERVLRIAMKPNDVVLDFFAGSGTTAHAVAQLNAEDGGSRKFILVSCTEATEDQPDKNLCRDVCAERVRRVLGGYTDAKGEEVAGLGGNFAYLRARRVPKHRLALKLDHGEIWNALELIHEQPLTPWPGGGFAHVGGIGYLADFRSASLQRMQAWCAVAEPGSVLYCWSPDRLRELADGINLRPIPQHLRDRFGR